MLVMVLICFLLFQPILNQLALLILGLLALPKTNIKSACHSIEYKKVNGYMYGICVCMSGGSFCFLKCDKSECQERKPAEICCCLLQRRQLDMPGLEDMQFGAHFIPRHVLGKDFTRQIQRELGFLFVNKKNCPQEEETNFSHASLYTRHCSSKFSFVGPKKITTKKSKTQNQEVN